MCQTNPFSDMSLSDAAEKMFRFLHNHCNHIVDMLIKYRQNHIYLALLIASMCVARKHRPNVARFSASAVSCKTNV